MRKIWKGNFVYTPNPTTLCIEENKYIIVEDGLVQAIVEQCPPGEPYEDLGDGLVLPAFSDTHIHGPQYPMAGLGMDKELLPWLETYTFPMERRYEKMELAERLYKRFFQDLWLHGTLHISAFTTVHKDSAFRFMELMDEAGIGGYAGKVNMDRNSPEFLQEEAEQTLADTEELIERAKALHHVRYILTPRFVPSVTEKVMTALGQMAEKYDLPIQSHLSENKGEVEWVKALHPTSSSYTDVYDSFGLLRQDKTVMAHCIWLDKKERQTLKEKGVWFAHCAMSNLDLASGIMPLRDYMDEGQRCTLASDIAGGHAMAMPRNIVSTIQAANMKTVETGCPRVSFTEALFLSTKGSGAFFGKTGSFEPGYAFDAIVTAPIEPDHPLTFTRKEQVEKFIYGYESGQIEKRYRNGVLLERPFA